MKSLDKKLKDAYDAINNEFKATGIRAFTYDDTKQMVASGKWPEENMWDEDHKPGFIVADKFEHKFNIDGAFDVYLNDDGEVSAVWMPFPSDPVVGTKNIIEEIKKTAGMNESEKHKNIDGWDDVTVNKMYNFYLDELSVEERKNEEKKNLNVDQKREMLKKQEKSFAKQFESIECKVNRKKYKTGSKSLKFRMKHVGLFEEFVEQILFNGINEKKTQESFADFLSRADRMAPSKLKKLMGDCYVDFPGTFVKDANGINTEDDVEEWFKANIGDSNFRKVKDWFNDNVFESSLNEATDKIYTIECENSGGYMSSRPSRYYYQTGTLQELIKAYSYTLEVGESWQHEKGNKKINRNPKTVSQLVDNLNKAVNNAAKDGYAGKHYRVLADGEEKKTYNG